MNDQLDAKTFASWGIDMIKIDGCYADTTKHYLNYPAFGKALNGTGRSIIYSCSWPGIVLSGNSVAENDFEIEVKLQ